MNFSFDESGGISSAALSEQNSNLPWLLILCSKFINFDILSQFTCSQHVCNKFQKQNKRHIVLWIFVFTFHMINVIQILKTNLYFLKDIKPLPDSICPLWLLLHCDLNLHYITCFYLTTYLKKFCKPIQ